jgi:hypothetical protein
MFEAEPKRPGRSASTDAAGSVRWKRGSTNMHEGKTGVESLAISKSEGSLG